MHSWVGWVGGWVLDGGGDDDCRYEDENLPAPMDHAEPMPVPDATADLPLPEDAITTQAYLASLGKDRAVSPLVRHLQSRPNPVEIRPNRHFDPNGAAKAPPNK